MLLVGRLILLGEGKFIPKEYLAFSRTVKANSKLFISEEMSSKCPGIKRNIQATTASRTSKVFINSNTRLYYKCPSPLNPSEKQLVRYSEVLDTNCESDTNPDYTQIKVSLSQKTVFWRFL